MQEIVGEIGLQNQEEQSSSQERIREREMQENKRKHFIYLNRYVMKNQIVFTGSSLMEQFPIHEFLFDFNIPLKVYNRGIGGYTTSDLLEALEECVFQLEPSRIFFSIGTNDLNSEKCEISSIMERTEELICRIRERLPKANQNYIAYYPVNPGAAQNLWAKNCLIHRTNEKICEANRELEKVARKYAVNFLNVNDALVDKKGQLKKEYTVDGIHMYANGYREIFEKLRPHLEKEILVSFDKA